MNEKCSKCGSEKQIIGVTVKDQGQYSDGQLKAQVGFLHPEAAIFRGRTYARFRANICGDCGYTELYAEEPALLFEAYSKTQKDAQASIIIEPPMG